MSDNPPVSDETLPPQVYACLKGHACSEGSFLSATHSEQVILPPSGTIRGTIVITCQVKAAGAADGHQWEVEGERASHAG